MTRKHTPGPWSEDEHENEKGYVQSVVMAGDYYVATCHKYAGFKVTEDVHKYNARLIAAAPDLLEALEKLLASAHDYQSGVDEAIAAIAKAKGQDQ